MTVSAHDSLAVISHYLKRQHVLTLCSGAADTLWCANCFYAYDEDAVTFCLMTETDTRHGELMRQQQRVAGTVGNQIKTVALIRGVQYAGVVSLLSGEAEHAARQRYLKRFPVAKLMSAPLWEIRINELKMTDNRLGFGRKHLWRREDLS